MQLLDLAVIDKVCLVIVRSKGDKTIAGLRPEPRDKSFVELRIITLLHTVGTHLVQQVDKRFFFLPIDLFKLYQQRLLLGGSNDEPDVPQVPLGVLVGEYSA